MNSPKLKVINDIVYANSLDVAEKFEKSHRNIMTLIRNKVEAISKISLSKIGQREPLFADNENSVSLLNFEQRESLFTNNENSNSFRIIAERELLLKVGFVLTSYKNSRGQVFPCYNLNDLAFDLIVMGLTGQKALNWQIQYAFEFRRMKRELKKAKDKIAEFTQLGLFPEDVREPEYTIAEVLEKLANIGLFNSHTTANGIKNKIKKGEILGRFDGRRYIIPESSLKSFVKKRELFA